MARQVGDGDPHALRRRLEAKRPVRGEGSGLRRPDDAVPIRPEHVHLAVHDRLRSVDPRAIKALALAELRVGERVLPAQVVPVVHVLREHQKLHTGHRLLPMQPRQDGVGGRAARAAFRGEQLDQHRGRDQGRHGGSLRATFGFGYAILNGMSEGSGRLRA